MTSIQEVYEPIESKAKERRDKGLHNLIPHQLHLPVESIQKLADGHKFTVPHHHMGSHVGGSILLLNPKNAEKIQNAYHKGKHAIMKLSPKEIHATFTHGRGFLSNLYEGAKKVLNNPVVKSVGHVVSTALDNPTFNEYAQKAVEGSATAIGTALGTFTGNPVLGAMAGNALGKAGASAIKNHKTIEHGINSLLSDPRAEAGELIANEIQERIPKKYRRIAEQAVYDYMPETVKKIERAEIGYKHPPFYSDLIEDYGDVVRRSDKAGYNTGYASKLYEGAKNANRLYEGAKNAYDAYKHVGNFSYVPEDVNITHAGVGLKKKISRNNKMKESREEMLERMRRLRSMRTKKGRGTVEDAKDAKNRQYHPQTGMGTRRRGKGLAEDIKKAYDTSINYLGSGVHRHRHIHGVGLLDDIRNGFNKVGDTLNNTFNPDKNGITQGINNITNTISNTVHNVEDFFGNISSQAKDFLNDPNTQAEATTLGRQLASTLIHQGIPVVASTLGSALADALAEGTLQPELLPLANFLGGQAGSDAGNYLANYIGDQTGLGLHHIHHHVKRGRGRPRKSGKGVENSVAFKKAMSQNFGGLKVHDQHIANKPVYDFHINPNVTRPSTEMTLSPYQRVNSPAMHPFIPQTYVQEGGTSAGYGGRGLVHAHKSGHELHYSKSRHLGHGLF